MKRLYFICPQQRGQIDGSFWSLRHDGYFSEYFGEVGLPRGGPYTKGSVRGSNCHSSCCCLSELDLLGLHDFFHRNDPKIHTFRNKKTAFFLTLRKNYRKKRFHVAINCRAPLGSTSAIFGTRFRAQNAGKACLSNAPSAFQLTEFSSASLKASSGFVDIITS